MAALAGSFLWATGSTFFTASVRRLGVFNLNFIRLHFALGFLALAMWIINGSPFPVQATAFAWGWLGLSALVGLVIGDLCYFGALKEMGPRLTLLMLSFSPPVTALTDLLLTGDVMGFWAIMGMLVTLGGVLLVVSEKRNGNGPSLSRVTAAGLWLGFGAAAFQAVGLVFSKIGLRDLDPLSGTFIRMAVAAPSFTLVLLLMRHRIRIANWDAKKKGMLFALGGAFFGPFLGVTMSLVAVKYTQAGVAMTILSTTPITILPFAMIVYKERVTLRALAGAVAAVIGVAMLTLM